MSGKLRFDLTGQVFHYYTVLKRGENAREGNPRWWCRCVCGQEKLVRGSSLKIGHTKSCGCFSRQLQKESNTTHGLTYYLPYKLWMAAKKRARTENLPFDLSMEDVQVPETCPVFGMKLIENTGRARDNSPSLDRKIPSVGYVKGNIAVISWKANRLKKAMTAGEIKKLFQYMEN